MRKGPITLDVGIDANGRLVPFRSLPDFAIRFYLDQGEGYGMIAYNGKDKKGFRSRQTLQFDGYKKSRSWLVHMIGCTRKELDEAFYGYMKAQKR